MNLLGIFLIVVVCAAFGVWEVWKWIDRW